jgi:hypothetical protein
MFHKESGSSYAESKECDQSKCNRDANLEDGVFGITHDALAVVVIAIAERMGLEVHAGIGPDFMVNLHEAVR